MSGRGSRRTDVTGRSTTRLKDAKALVDVGPQFIGHPRTMRESPSWRWLSWQARKFIDRLELEHMAHAGRENGKLSVSYRQFIEAGISENCIPRAMVECMAAGLVERTSKGGKAVGDYRPTSTYRLTYVAAAGVITHEWHSLKTFAEIDARFDRMWAQWKEENPPRRKKEGEPAQAENRRKAS